MGRLEREAHAVSLANSTAALFAHTPFDREERPAAACASLSLLCCSYARPRYVRRDAFLVLACLLLTTAHPFSLLHVPTRNMFNGASSFNKAAHEPKKK